MIILTAINYSKEKSEVQAQLPYSLIIKSNFFFIHIFRIKSTFFWKGSFKTFHLLLSGLFTDFDVKYQRFIYLLLTDIYFQAQDIAFYFQHKILNPYLWFSFLMQIIIILTVLNQCKNLKYKPSLVRRKF